VPGLVKDDNPVIPPPPPVNAVVCVVASLNVICVPFTVIGILFS
jgi:hypothetical protein